VLSQFIELMARRFADLVSDLSHFMTPVSLRSYYSILLGEVKLSENRHYHLGGM
jgi:hypothetical protein